MSRPIIKKIPFTKTAYEKLQQDFAKFTKERVEVMERLITAREMGDLSENGAYKYAKFELGDIGRQLKKIKNLLENGEIVEVSTTDTAGFGSTITISHNKKESTYMLVTQHESNPMENKLSVESPIGTALLGKKAGDIVTVQTPVGEKQYTIISVN